MVSFRETFLEFSSRNKKPIALKSRFFNLPHALMLTTIEIIRPKLLKKHLNIFLPKYDLK